MFPDPIHIIPGNDNGGSVEVHEIRQFQWFLTYVPANKDLSTDFGKGYISSWVYGWVDRSGMDTNQDNIDAYDKKIYQKKNIGTRKTYSVAGWLTQTTKREMWVLV